MKKSKERINLEKMIKISLENSLNIFQQMVLEEFNGDLEAAFGDESFISRMHNKVRYNWDLYKNSYRKLEDLESRENYVAMFDYARQLDIISCHLPSQNRIFCHYPFSAIDIYWARIFQQIVFEDSGFDSEIELPTMWWNAEDYGKERRNEILSTLRKLNIIPVTTIINFLSHDAEIGGDVNNFNNTQSTLLTKGTDFLEFVKIRFSQEPLKYGAIILGSPYNPIDDIEDRLHQDFYYKHFYLKGSNFYAPYPQKLRDVYIFLKHKR